MTKDEFIMQFMIAAAPAMVGEFHKGERTTGQIVDATYNMAVSSMYEMEEHHHLFDLETTNSVIGDISLSVGEHPEHSIAESLQEIALSVHEIREKL